MTTFAKQAYCFHKLAIWPFRAIVLADQVAPEMLDTSVKLIILALFTGGKVNSD